MPRSTTAADASSRRAIGLRAEDAVADHLTVRGFTILGRNVRLGALELDLVARKGELAVVVEVRTRGAGSWVSALGSIGSKKRALLLRATERLWRERLAKMEGVERVRIDVAAVDLGEGDTRIEYIEAAITG